MADVWFEGHVGLYFPQRLARWPGLQRRYLAACHALGLGYHRGGTAGEWAKERQHILTTNVFHHDVRAFTSLATKVFGTEPASLAAEYLRFRLGSALGLVRAPLLDGPLAFVSHKRAGRFFVMRRAS
jgi:hypothetical protein